MSEIIALLTGYKKVGLVYIYKFCNNNRKRTELSKKYLQTQSDIYLHCSVSTLNFVENCPFSCLSAHIFHMHVLLFILLFLCLSVTVLTLLHVRVLRAFHRAAYYARPY